MVLLKFTERHLASASLKPNVGRKKMGKRKGRAAAGSTSSTFDQSSEPGPDVLSERDKISQAVLAVRLNPSFVTHFKKLSNTP